MVGIGSMVEEKSVVNRNFVSVKYTEETYNFIIIIIETDACVYHHDDRCAG